jgi:hypothetical protein
MPGPRLGRSPRVGIGRIAQAGIRNIPGSNQVMRENGELQAQQMGQRANRIADDLSPDGTPMSAGAALQGGIRDGYIPRFKSVAEQSL